MDRRPVLVAGGGIGGLCVALTLHQIGVPPAERDVFMSRYKAARWTLHSSRPIIMPGARVVGD